MIKYPNPSKNNKTTQPNNINKTISAKTITRGMEFESQLNNSNEYYRSKGIAYIYKKPTPVQVVKVDYPSRSHAKIVEAYYRTPSTTDYNGIYKGKYIDYEAKETHNKSFAFDHIFPHQLEHLQNCKRLGGISFIIIYFKQFDSVVIIDIDDFMVLYNESKKTEKYSSNKSIKYEKALEIGAVCPRGYTPLIDYLSAVNKLYNLGD